MNHFWGYFLSPSALHRASFYSLKGPLTEKDIESGGYTAVLLVDESVGFQLKLNEACRKAGTAFVSASSRGPFASLFCDFGESFVVEDQDGEEALVRSTEWVIQSMLRGSAFSSPPPLL